MALSIQSVRIQNARFLAVSLSKIANCAHIEMSFCAHNLTFAFSHFHAIFSLSPAKILSFSLALVWPIAHWTVIWLSSKRNETHRKLMDETRQCRHGPCRWEQLATEHIRLRSYADTLRVCFFPFSQKINFSQMRTPERNDFFLSSSFFCLSVFSRHCIEKHTQSVSGVLLLAWIKIDWLSKQGKKIYEVTRLSKNGRKRKILLVRESDS